jgi:ATP-dependent exoDNAse (exonuclease V) beta subunit
MYIYTYIHRHEHGHDQEHVHVHVHACTLGCSDFNNFIIPTLGWLQKFILRPIHKRRFSFILSRFMRVKLQNFEKVLNRAKNNYFWKNRLRVSKNAEFYAELKSVEKVAKKFTQKKLLPKNEEKTDFFNFYYCSSKFLAYNFC